MGISVRHLAATVDIEAPGFAAGDEHTATITVTARFAEATTWATALSDIIEELPGLGDPRPLGLSGTSATGAVQVVTRTVGWDAAKSRWSLRWTMPPDPFTLDGDGALSTVFLLPVPPAGQTLRLEQYDRSNSASGATATLWGFSGGSAGSRAAVAWLDDEDPDYDIGYVVEAVRNRNPN